MIPHCIFCPLPVDVIDQGVWPELESIQDPDLKALSNHLPWESGGA